MSSRDSDTVNSPYFTHPMVELADDINSTPTSYFLADFTPTQPIEIQFDLKTYSDHQAYPIKATHKPI